MPSSFEVSEFWLPYIFEYIRTVAVNELWNKKYCCNCCKWCKLGQVCQLHRSVQWDGSSVEDLVSAAENATNDTDSIEGQVDTVAVARKFLIAHPEACRQYVTDTRHISKGADKRHDHGSDRCISAFLGEEGGMQRTDLLIPRVRSRG
jgi:hypothetical protein